MISEVEGPEMWRAGSDLFSYIQDYFEVVSALHKTVG